jgi:hypothetical protein
MAWLINLVRLVCSNLRTRALSAATSVKQLATTSFPSVQRCKQFVVAQIASMRPMQSVILEKLNIAFIAPLLEEVIKFKIVDAIELTTAYFGLRQSRVHTRILRACVGALFGCFEGYFQGKPLQRAIVHAVFTSSNTRLEAVAMHAAWNCAYLYGEAMRYDQFRPHVVPGESAVPLHPNGNGNVRIVHDTSCPDRLKVSMP